MLKPYLDYILDKEIVMQEVRQSVMVVKQVLNKNPETQLTHNAIHFLNSFTEKDIRKENIKDEISTITWARKVVRNYQHLDTVQAKIDIMNHQIKEFIELFNPFVQERNSFLLGRERRDVVSKGL